MFTESTIPEGADEAARAASLGISARSRGDEALANRYFRDAMFFAVDAKNSLCDHSSFSSRVERLRTAIRYALECGEVTQAREWVGEAFKTVPSLKFDEEWIEFNDLSKWKETWLVAAISRECPDEAALDELANRSWKGLYGRCFLLTLNEQNARDLAQEAWCRVLRRRTYLKAGGNFKAYLAKVATNLWRDSCRSEGRAGPLANHRLESLDGSSGDGEEGLSLRDRIHDLKSLSSSEQMLLAIDIDEALGRLAPRLREVAIARFIDGESCAEIAKRFGRTQQSISGWIRQALHEMKVHLESSKAPSQDSARQELSSPA